MTARKTNFRTARRPRPSWLLAFAVVLFAAPIHAQSLGEIARENRASKQSEALQSAHVYTNDDLKHDKILLPTDRDRIQSTTQLAPPTPTAQPNANANASATASTNATLANSTPTANTNVTALENEDTNSMPLGDIARHYRALRAAREQQQAAQSAAQQPAPKIIAAHTPQPSRAVASIALAPTTEIAAPPPVSANATGLSSEDESNMSLGEIARYYRAQKAVRDREQAQLAAQQRSLPAAPALAYPTFTQPTARKIAAPKPAATVSRSPETASREVRHEIEAAAGDIRVRVQSGDTLWALARHYLGHGTDWHLLAAQNPQVLDPAKLQVGNALSLPEIARAVGVVQSARTVRVKRGESLWTLSQAHFGNGAGWACIARSNPDLLNANMIFPGQILSMPASCSNIAPTRIEGPSILADSSVPLATHQLQQTDK